MFEQMKRAALLLVGAALFAPLAWGQVPTLSQSAVGMVTVASEYFGQGESRDVVMTGRNPSVVLTVGSSTADEATTDDGNTATVTFTFTGATLGAAVGSGSLKAVRTSGGNCATDITGTAVDTTVSRTAGGAAGDGFVTFDIEVGDDGLNGGGTCDDKLVFTVPNLRATPVDLDPAGPAPGMPNVAMGAAVTASIEQGRTSGDALPNAIRGTGTRPANSINPMADGRILALAPAIAPTLSAGVPSVVAPFPLTSRVNLVAGNEFKAESTDTAKQSLLVGSLGVTIKHDGTGAPRQLTQDEAVASFSVGDADDSGTLSDNAGLGGTIKITVSASGSRGFEDGDMVYYGANTSVKPFTAEASGAMSYSVQINKINPTEMIRFVPNGTSALRPMTLTASLALDFTDTKAASGAVDGVTSSASISYAGIATKAYAYGVVRAGAMERSFVRVGCKTNLRGCLIFADCTDQAGNGYFGELRGMLRNATAVYTSEDIANSFSPADGWQTGRGSCELLSNGALEVQHMVRSGEGQVNNSIVIGSGTVGISGTSTASQIGILGK